MADFVTLKSKNKWRSSPRNQSSQVEVVVLAEAPIRAVFIQKFLYRHGVGDLEDIPSKISITKLQIRGQEINAPLSA